MTVIALEGVSKRFALHHERPRSFQEVFLAVLRGEIRRRHEEFWVLRNVDLRVERGESIALIGPNGAGKSTVLKLVSRIIEPTLGQVHVQGRVGALLELGAGFHPDLTGRENIFLHGSILGLSRPEVRRRFDDIVSFAELERFIDVPLRHYSSGMYVRLGFAVAVHTDPEILLVDEVLAVGDQNFQHKCLERIAEMKKTGITICYVSHDLGTVRKLCSQAVWIEDGLVQAAGDVANTISSYLRHMASREESRLAGKPAPALVATNNAQRRWGTGGAQITAVRFLDGSGNEKKVFHVGESWEARLSYLARQRIERPIFGLAVHRDDGVHVCGPNTSFAGLDIPFVEGAGEIISVDSLPLMEGTYQVSVAVHNQADTVMYDYQDRLYSFRVRQVGDGERYGLVSMGGSWQWQAPH